MNDGVEGELRRLEREFAEAFVVNDAEAMGRMLGDDWLLIGGKGGVLDKARFLEVIRSGEVSHSRLDLSEIRVRVYGDTAILVGRADVGGTLRGAPFTWAERLTDVFVRRDGRWVWVHTHLCKIVED